MSDQEMLIAYDLALRAYEAAKAGKGYRVKASEQFISAETALVNHFGPEVLTQYRDRSLLSVRHMDGSSPASVVARTVERRRGQQFSGHSGVGCYLKVADNA